MLLRKNFGWSHKHGLKAVEKCQIHGYGTDNRFSASHVSRKKPVHGFRRRNVLKDFFNRPLLGVCQCKRKTVPKRRNFLFKFCDKKPVPYLFCVPLFFSLMSGKIQQKKLIKGKPVLCFLCFLQGVRKMDFPKRLWEVQELMIFKNVFGKILCKVIGMFCKDRVDLAPKPF